MKLSETYLINITHQPFVRWYIQQRFNKVMIIGIDLTTVLLTNCEYHFMGYFIINFEL